MPGLLCSLIQHLSVPYPLHLIAVQTCPQSRSRMTYWANHHYTTTPTHFCVVSASTILRGEVSQIWTRLSRARKLWCCMLGLSMGLVRPSSSSSNRADCADNLKSFHRVRQLCPSLWRSELTKQDLTRFGMIENKVSNHITLHPSSSLR